MLPNRAALLLCSRAIQVQDEIQKLKYKEPSSTKIVELEQELVRAEAQSLVAEAQLTNVTRQKFKEAYDIQTAAIIERAEKQIILAKNARSLLNLLDDTPVVPGDAHHPFQNTDSAREVLNNAEDELRNWEPTIEPVHSSAGALGSNAMPSGPAASVITEDSAVPTTTEYTSTLDPGHPLEHDAPTTTAETTQPPYPVTEEEPRVAA